MLLQEYDITFVHIKGKDNILANAISRLCTVDIYEKTIESQPSPAVKTPITQQEGTIDLIQHIDSTPLLQSLNLSSTTLWTLKNKISSVKTKHVNYIQLIKAVFTLIMKVFLNAH